MSSFFFFSEVRDHECFQKGRMKRISLIKQAYQLQKLSHCSYLVVYLLKKNWNKKKERLPRCGQIHPKKIHTTKETKLVERDGNSHPNLVFWPNIKTHSYRFELLQSWVISKFICKWKSHCKARQPGKRCTSTWGERVMAV